MLLGLCQVLLSALYILARGFCLGLFPKSGIIDGRLPEFGIRKGTSQRAKAFVQFVLTSLAGFFIRQAVVGMDVFATTLQNKTKTKTKQYIYIYIYIY